MPKIVSNKLTIRTVERLKAPGMHADGGGLYLFIGKPNSDGGQARSWIFRYVTNGRARELGLGPARDIALPDARSIAAELRRKRALGEDPAETRAAERAEAKSKERAARAKAHTFKDAFESLLAAKDESFKNQKHKAQWRMTLETYAAPLHRIPVADVTTQDIVDALRPIWTSKGETASRTRGRIEAVLDAARVAGFIEENVQNPARWSGHLDVLLPAPAKLIRGHHKAVSWQDMPNLIKVIRESDAISARALEFLILCASRTGELIGAQWSEIDMAGRTWTIAAERMKAGREHVVPLNERALEILDGMACLGKTGFVFREAGAKRGLSNMAMPQLLKRIGRAETVHGFRSSFRDWSADNGHSREVAEECLAHVLANKVEAAYRRSTLFDQRKNLLSAWATYLDQ